MYEQNEVSVFRRFLWIALGFIVAVVIVWVLVWLIFFHHEKSKTTPLNKPSTSQSQQSKKAPSANSNNSGSSPTEPSQGTTAPTAEPITASPTELVNTGAGDLVAPFVIATSLGAVFYHLRLSRKARS